MSHTRLYVDQPLQTDSEIEIGGDRARYLGRVLRLRTDDEISLFDGGGGEYKGRIRSIKKNNVQIVLGAHVMRNTESQLAIHLLQGISRNDRMDLVMQKATELGVARVTPLITDYSQTRLAQERAEKRLQRWRGITASACEQCGRNKLPIIDAPISLRNWAGQNLEATGARIILMPAGTASLTNIKLPDSAATVLIGPEGGFSDEEYALTATLNFVSVNLGPRILRTETAAIVALSALQMLHGDLTAV